MNRYLVSAFFLFPFISVLGWSMLACGGSEAPIAAAPETQPKQWGELDGTSWSWTEAECVDRPLDLTSRGFEQYLQIRAHSEGLLLIFDSDFKAEDCARTVVLLARSGYGPTGWQFQEQARIALPPTDQCRGSKEGRRSGVIRPSADRLELVIHRSTWCDGFDVRFSYQRASPGHLTDQQLIRHYVAHFNRRDADSIAGLFAATGSLLEPFTPTSDGNLKRRSGRLTVRAWYTSAFKSVSWLAMRLLAVSRTGPAGQHIAQWEYMDSGLQTPFRGRNLFLIAGGEIYETELQVTTEIVPRQEESSSQDATSSGQRTVTP